MQKIVIVGGGAGGLELATRLGRTLGKEDDDMQVMLVDKNSSHFWKPLLHEIAAGTLNEYVDGVDYRALGKHNHFKFRQGELLEIDRQGRQIKVGEVRSEQGEVVFPQVKLDYDVLVMAVGSRSNDFGTPGVREHCIFLEDQVQAKALHQKMLALLYRFSAGLGAAQERIRIAVVGGGATGVELSSELLKMADTLRSYGVEKMDAHRLKVTLIESSERILPAMPEKLAQSIQKTLEKSGVRVLTDTMITRADAHGFYSQEGDVIEADIMIWTGGVKAPEFLKDIAGLETNRSNQLVVTPTLQTTRDERIFAMGDCAASLMPEGGYVPATAQAANQMSITVAQNLVAYLKGQPLKVFKYKDKGTIITLADTAQGVVSTLGGSQITVKGAPANFIHSMIYRMHQTVLYGVMKTFRLMMSSKLIRSVKSALDLDDRNDNAHKNGKDEDVSKR